MPWVEKTALNVYKRSQDLDPDASSQIPISKCENY